MSYKVKLHCAGLKVLLRQTRILIGCLLIAANLSATPSGRLPRGIGDDHFNLQTNRTITGKVSNQSGEPLSGATIKATRSGKTVNTASDGTFSIEVSDGNDVLIISYVGMASKEFRINANASTVSIQLEEIQNALSEVLVVGYGTQKKANLTGAVATVNSRTLLERPATNASNLLQGRLPGLRVTQPTGIPGKNDGLLEVRGLGSFGASSAPLVLVDGVIGTISNVAPNDIESVTVLKDAASASIYGARAANGVILITTKNAKKGLLIEYKLDVSSQSATRLPDLIYNSGEYMEMYNSAAQRSGQPLIYTQQQIDSYKNAENDPQYPNFNWMDYYFNPALVTNHYLSISNGNENSSYKFSLNYLNEDGILPNYKYKRYNAQLNFNNRISKSIRIGTIIGAIFKDINEPPGALNENESMPIHVIQNGPTYSPFLPDGSGRKTSSAYANEGHNASSPVAFTNGSIFTKSYGLNAQAFVDINLMRGLVWSSKAAINYSDNFQKNWRYATLDHYFFQKLPGNTDYSIDPTVTSPVGAGVTDTYVKSVTPTLYSTFAYETTIGKDHNLKAMVGYEQSSNITRQLGGTRLSFPVTSLMELNAGAANGQTNNGTAYEWALQSFFGRVNYDYKGKYLLEVNARYDGTSRVSSQNRWGLFPSISAGWKISDEAFLKNIGWLNNLKFRGSWGTLGNQEIGNYPYQDIFSFTQYPFGSTLSPAVQVTRLTDKNLKWESTRIIDFGFDLDVVKNKFGVTFDWFKKNTTDILATIPVPASLGLTGPVSNDGELQNTGWELELRHRNKIGEVSYSANFMISSFKNKLLSIVTPTLGINEVGLPYNSYYLYEMIGIFQSQDEIDKSPKQIFYAPKPGDIKIKDQNGDNVIDAKDRVSYTPYPKYTYSFGLSASWKAFDLSVFLQGVSGMKSVVYGWGWDPFVQGSPPSTRFRDAWSPTNPSNTIPAVYIGSGGSTGGYGGVNAYKSTYDLVNASYLRVKSINLSYELSKRIAQKIRSKGLNIYVSADNLFTFTKYPGTDPERRMDGPSGGRAFYYPQVRILNVGVNVKF